MRCMVYTLNKFCYPLLLLFGIILLICLLASQPLIPAKQIDFKPLLAPDDFNKEFPPVNSTPEYLFLSNYNLSYQNNHYLPKYHLHYCKIDKNGGSALQAVICFLSDPKKYRRFFLNAVWPPGLYGRGAGICGWATTNGTIRRQTEIEATKMNFFERNDVLHFAVIRHPISRFVSAWLDICGVRYNDFGKYCYKCKQDLNCFVENHYWYVRHKSEKKERFAKRWRGDWHFYPQSWFCDFHKNLDKYILLEYQRGDRLVDQLLEILQTSQVPSGEIDVIGKTLRDKSTTHKGSDSGAKNILDTIYSNTTLLRLLYNTYYTDFNLLKYDIEMLKQ